jgi:hypothetical protein
MSNEVLGKDSVEVEDVVELNTIDADASIPMGKKKKVNKRRKTSIVWNYFDVVPNRS